MTSAVGDCDWNLGVSAGGGSRRRAGAASGFILQRRGCGRQVAGARGVEKRLKIGQAGAQNESPVSVSRAAAAQRGEGKPMGGLEAFIRKLAPNGLLTTF